MGDRKKILIVEDDEAIADFLIMVFETAGFDIELYANGRGILTGDYQVPDLFILDNQLPGPDGLSICKFLKSEARTAHIPVIIQSASPQAKLAAGIVGADAFIEKPFNIPDMLATVKKLLNKNELI